MIQVLGDRPASSSRCSLATTRLCRSTTRRCYPPSVISVRISSPWRGRRGRLPPLPPLPPLPSHAMSPTNVFLPISPARAVGKLHRSATGLPGPLVIVPRISEYGPPVSSVPGVALSLGWNQCSRAGGYKRLAWILCTRYRLFFWTPGSQHRPMTVQFQSSRDEGSCRGAQLG